VVLIPISTHPTVYTVKLLLYIRLFVKKKKTIIPICEAPVIIMHRIENGVQMIFLQPHYSDWAWMPRI
jgi:hypothetical protein